MIRLYAYWRSSASYRVRLALNHKELPYEVVTISLLSKENRSDAHLTRNPIGQVPVIELEHDGKLVRLAQSLAILEYLEERFPERALLPRDAYQRALVRELAELVNSGIQPLQNTPVLDRVARELSSDSNVWARFFIERGLHALEARARETAGEFMVGDAPSFADVCLLPQLYNARRFAVDLSGLPTLTRVEARALSLPRWELAAPERQPDADKPST